jgi:transaldolase
LPAWEQTKGNDGYVTFELDPLIEDEAAGFDLPALVRRYLELGEKWSAGHTNRMIKVPASAAGIDLFDLWARHLRSHMGTLDLYQLLLPERWG